MSHDAAGASRPGMVPNKSAGLDLRILDPLHLQKRTRPRADEAHIIRHFIGIDIMRIAVPIGDDHLVVMCLEGGLSRRSHIARHPLSRGIPLPRPSIRSERLWCRDTGTALH